MIAKVPLFKSFQERGLFLVFLLFILLMNVSWRYMQYKAFKQNAIHGTYATVLSAKKKISQKNNPYYLLSLKADNIIFSTPAFIDADFQDAIVWVEFPTKSITFFAFLHPFYIYAKHVHVVDRCMQDEKKDFFLSQHKEGKIKSLYGALFFAHPTTTSLREDISKWGVAHLLAISGYHMGLLFGIIFFVFKWLMYPFYNRYYPYRNLYIDATLLSFVWLFIYAYYIGFVPSVLRAFVMMVFLFYLYVKGISLLSFETLAVVVGGLLAFFLELMFSLGFWFSVVGVFYIYLYLHYVHIGSKWLLGLGLSFYVYVMMLPIVHHYFDVFSLFQLLSPLLSIVFSLFYPFVLVLHLSGYGNLLDNMLIIFLEMPVYVNHISLSTQSLYIYMLVSLLGIYKKVFFYVAITASLGFLIYMVLDTINTNPN